MSQLIEIASKELGIREQAGNQHNERILQYAQEVGILWVSTDETPWCSIFLNWVAEQAGLQRSKSAMARSWLKVGSKVSTPVPGDVVVFWRESPSSTKGHVGLFMGYSKDRHYVFVLGGNQRNSVCIQRYRASRVLGFRRLRPQQVLVLPKRELSYGDYGLAVAKLQEALAYLGYFDSPVDGTYGQETYEAVWFLQDYSGYLEATGDFDAATREYVLEKATELAAPTSTNA